MPVLKIFLLGTPRLELDGAVVEFDTRKAEALLAYLAVTNEPVRRDTLALLLWPDYDTSNGRAALRRTLSALRKGIGGEFLEISYETIGLAQNGAIWVDAFQFHQQLEHVRAHRHPAGSSCAGCLEALGQAAALYRGDFLIGFGLRDSANFDDWQFFQADQLRQELSWVLEQLTLAHAGQADYESAITSARRWLSLDPLREDAHRQLMHLFAWSGQRNAALRQYRECVRILQQEIGVPPMEETSRLYQQILERKLDTPPQPVTQPGSLVENAPDLPRVQAEAAAQPPVSAAALSDFTCPLIGRASEWQTLVLCHAAAQQDGWLVLLEGEAGIGKTRLAEDFLLHARLLGGRVFQARSYEGEANLAYGPFIEGLSLLLKDEQAVERLSRLPAHWLSEAARLLPDIASLFPALPEPAPLDSPGAQSRFFESIRRVLVQLLSGPLPGVLMIDDLHWLDSASLELLTYIARRLEHCALLLLLTWRGRQSENSTQILQVLAEAQRQKRGTRLLLEPWGEAEVVELIRSWPGDAQSLGEHFSQRLYRESEGLPLYTISFLRSYLQTAGSQPAGPPELPADMRNVWLAQVSALDEISQQLLSTAAVIGHSFDFTVLKEASGRSELEALNGLERLLQVRLIRECNRQVQACESSYDFTHEKLRQMVYHEISLARKQLIHRRVAEALLNSARSRKEGGKLASQVAYHYQQAGQSSQAAEFFKQAGEQARSLFANVAALAHFESALSAGYPDAAGLHETIADLHTLSGEYPAAIHNYETAAALCLPPALARLEHKLGEVYARKGDWQLAACYYQLALGDSDANEDRSLKALILSDGSLAAHRLDEDSQALELAQQSLALAQNTNDLPALAQAYNILGMLARARGDLEEALSHLNSSLQIAQRLAEPARQAAALNNLALVHGDQDQLDQAIQLSHQALSLCAQQGDRHREAALLSNLADLYHAAGQTQEAQEYLHKSVVLFTEIGEKAGEQEPGIWKLSEW
jgi:predicted ATPase